MDVFIISLVLVLTNVLFYFNLTKEMKGFFLFIFSLFGMYLVYLYKIQEII